MKKFTIICIVAAAAFMMSSCGNKMKKAAEVEATETEVVAEEVAPAAEEMTTESTDVAAEGTATAETPATI